MLKAIVFASLPFYLYIKLYFREWDQNAVIKYKRFKSVENGSNYLFSGAYSEIRFQGGEQIRDPGKRPNLIYFGE